MATKAQRFRYQAEREKPGKPKQPKRPRRDTVVDTALPGVSATDRKAGGKLPGERNLSQAAARKASYALEETSTRPSRKSTRKSANRQKADSQLERQQTRALRSPKARAIRKS